MAECRRVVIFLTEDKYIKQDIVWEYVDCCIVSITLACQCAGQNQYSLLSPRDARHTPIIHILLLITMALRNITDV
jgi:hypothetical protein